MTRKRRFEPVVETESAAEVESTIEVVAEAESAAEVAAEIEKPAHEKHTQVRVRVLAEQGLLAGRAVWRGEVHQVAYWQFQQAVDANPDGYVLMV